MREKRTCFRGSVDFLVGLNASMAGGDFDGGEGVKEDVDAVGEWMCSICVADSLSEE